MKLKYIAWFLIILLLLINITAYAIPEPANRNNIAPTIDLSVTPAKKLVDIVILTDYTGTKLTALNTQINALKAKFSAVNVDPEFHIVSSVKKVGTQNDELYMFRRYAYYNYQVHYKEIYSPATSWDYYHNYWDYEKVVWEEAQVLASQVGNLPKRNPQNISFTRSSLLHRETSTSETDYYNVVIKCTNDIKTSSENIEVIKRRNTDYLATVWEFDYIMAENATIDKDWKAEYKISDVSYDVYSLDFDKLSVLPLRTGSERHMMFISDAYAKDYGKGFGNYFCFGDLTETLKTYIKTNNFSLYGVVTEYARDRTLQPDKVAEVVPLGSTALFYMRNGQVLKPVACSEFTGYSDIEDIGNIKEVIKTNNISYLFMEDGTIKYYDSVDDTIKAIPGLTNVVKVYNFDNNGSLYILDSSGKVYIGSSGGATAFNNSVAISDIFRVQGRNIYITSTGIPYMEYYTYNSYTKVTIDHFLTRAKIKNGTSIRYLPNIKDAAYFQARAVKNGLAPSLILYTTGQIQQFVRIETVYSKSGYLTTSTPYLIEDAAYNILETNVQSIDSNGNCIFIFKNDGTVKMLKTDWVQDVYYDKDDDAHSYIRPVLKNNTINVPLTDIQKIINSGMERYFFIDSNNNTYMYAGDYQAPAPVIGTTLKIMGNNISKIVTSVNTDGVYSFVFLLYNDGSVGQLPSRYFYSSYYGFFNWSQYSLSLLPVNSIKDIYTSAIDTYFLKDDGMVSKRINAYYYQNNFIDCFTDTITIDTTKSYLSLLDIFNEAANGVFYPTGQYTAAFSSIYNNYSSYSGTGNMYVLLGEDIKYQSTYSDYEKDPEYSRKWKISHGPYHFDNSMGLSAYHNPTGFATSPPAKLDKVGKYVINLYARDNPKSNIKFLNDSNEDKNYYKWSLGNHNLTVYVHRKPVALQRITVTDNGNGTLTIQALDAGSYDLDHSATRVDNGVIAREWRWRESTSTVWIAGQMNKADCKPDVSYITQLRVKDVEGVWSDYDTITIDASDLYIDAVPTYSDWTNSSVTATVFAYSYNSAINNIKYRWTTNTTKPTSGWATTTNSSFNTSKATQGVWYLHIESTDSRGNTAYRYRGPYQIDLTAPAIDCSPTSLTSTSSFNVNVTASDTGGSGLKQVGYRLTTSTTKPTSGWTTATSSGFSVSVPDGIYYLHMQAFDNAGNSYYRYRGPFTYVSNRPPTVSLYNAPSFVYEGDTLKINVVPSDPDSNPLSVVLQEKVGAGSFTTVLNQSNVASGSTVTYTRNNVGVGTYQYSVVVTDSFGATAPAALTVTVHPLGVTGEVSHTDLWNEHRIDYNMAKSGSSDSPRPYSAFFPGESFVLKAQTSSIDSQSSVYASQVTCSIVSSSFITSLSNVGGNTWQGSLWDELMMLWADQTVTFRFSATYSNGTVKSQDVIVNVRDDAFWRQHLRF